MATNDTYNNTINGDTTTDDTVADTAARTGNSEPATGHDVSEGGIIGAVGGAVVGALAGGPVGAVIGAVAGGAASAGAVDVVDQHDNDYDRTVNKDNDIDNNAYATAPVGVYGTSNADGTVSGYAGTANDYGVTTGADVTPVGDVAANEREYAPLDTTVDVPDDEAAENSTAGYQNASPRTTNYSGTNPSVSGTADRTLSGNE